MAATASPVELPTARHSVYFSQTDAPDVTDPNWIPLLAGGVVNKRESLFSEKEVSPYNASTFGPLAAKTQESASRSQSPYQTQTTSSSATPEPVLSELEAAPLPERKSSKHPYHSASSDHLRGSSDGHETATSEGENSTAPSTVDSVAALEEQYYTIPTMEVTKEDIQPAVTPMSARSSMVSAMSRNTFVPTSKYSRRGVHSSVSAVTRATTIRSQSTSPQASPNLSEAVPAFPASAASLPLVHETPEQMSPTSRQAPPLPSPTATSPPISSPSPVTIAPTPPPAPPVTSPRLQATKSTASDRRARALHSHPSAQQLKSSGSPNPDRSTSPTEPAPQSLQQHPVPPSPSPDIADILPKPPSVKHRSRRPSCSTETHQQQHSRPTTPRSIYEHTTNPTPAPTQPLPSLPPEAFMPGPSAPNSRKPSVRTIRTIGEGHIAAASVVSLPRTIGTLGGGGGGEGGMADFMSRKSTVVFRRFDEVHVRLLVGLQEEIEGLEGALFALEEADANGVSGVEGDAARVGQKMRVMRELRRVVGEYDHLFANWSNMQANKADPQVVKDLREWLQQPRQGGGAKAAEELRWLDRQTDLSSVRLSEKDGAKNDGEKRQREEKLEKDGNARGGSGAAMSGFAKLFSCAGKRK